MKTNHFPERKLDPNGDTESSWVIWTRHEPKGAVVFVHGFMGGASKTWKAFESLLPSRDKAKCYDLFSYGYNCTTSSTMAQGRLLCDFLDQLWTSPESLARDSAGRNNKFRYKRVVLIGHSIGAIVCRRALLLARDLGHKWMPNTSMILFAPAHRGCIVTARLNDLSDSWLNLFVTGWRFKRPLVDEVAQNSPSIAKLQQDSRDAIQKGAKFLIAQKVIIAEEDLLVDNLQFVQDPAPDVILGTTHTTVCKPRATFTHAVDHVEQAL